MKIDEFDEIAKSLGWDTDDQIARAIGCGTVHLWRIRNHYRTPGPRFVAGLLAAIRPYTFDHVFEVVPDKAA